MRGNENRRHFHRLDRKSVIHEPLAVAGLELKPAHLALQKRHIGDRTVVDHLHLAVDRIAEQPGTALGEGVIDIVVDRGNVDARFDQHRNGPVQLRRKERKREVPRIGHHTHVQRLGHTPRNRLRSQQLFENLVDQESGARRAGT